jgi:hypothetical protein
MYLPNSRTFTDTKRAETPCQVWSSLIQKPPKTLIQLPKKAMTAVKKTGVKLRIAVDILGLPYAAIVTTANISDIAGGIQMFSQPGFYSFSTVQTDLCDGTYEGENFANAIKELIGANVEVAKRSELVLNYISLRSFQKDG